MTVLELICRELARSKEDDPSVVARRVLPKLSAKQREELLVEGVEQLAHQAVLQSRQEKRSGNAPAKSGPSRWKVAMPERVYVGEWKLLEKCGAEDLLWLAADYRMRAEQMAVKATEFEQLAHDLEGSGCATVGEMWARAQVAA